MLRKITGMYFHGRIALDMYWDMRNWHIMRKLMGRCLVGLFLGRDKKVEISSCFSSQLKSRGYFYFLVIIFIERLNEDEELEQFAPWSELAQETCK